VLGHTPGPHITQPRAFKDLIHFEMQTHGGISGCACKAGATLVAYSIRTFFHDAGHLVYKCRPRLSCYVRTCIKPVLPRLGKLLCAQVHQGRHFPLLWYFSLQERLFSAKIPFWGKYRPRFAYANCTWDKNVRT